jgi:hypothetical protein
MDLQDATTGKEEEETSSSSSMSSFLEIQPEMTVSTTPKQIKVESQRRKGSGWQRFNYARQERKKLQYSSMLEEKKKKKQKVLSSTWSSFSHSGGDSEGEEAPDMEVALAHLRKREAIVRERMSRQLGFDVSTYGRVKKSDEVKLPSDFADAFSSLERNQQFYSKRGGGQGRQSFNGP